MQFAFAMWCSFVDVPLLGEVWSAVFDSVHASIIIHVSLLFAEQGCGLEMIEASQPAEETSFTITGLEENQEYSVEVTTVSQAAIGDPAPAVIGTTSMSSECVSVFVCAF